MMSSRFAPWIAATVLAAAAFAQSPTYHAARQPSIDHSIATIHSGDMLSIPGLFTDFVLAGGGQFVELPSGEARLTGRVFSNASIYSAYLLDIVFSGRVAPADPGYPPAGGPDLQLVASAYAPSGTVDPNQFTYYTSASGTLTGTRNLDGCVLGVTLGSLPAQVGLGANNRNSALGLEAVLNVTILQQAPGNPVGPLTTATFLLDLPTHQTQPITHPQVDTLRSTLAYGRAMVMPGVGDDYVFVPAGAFTEFDNGTATATGTLARIDQLDDQWAVTVNFTNRLDPGQAGHPPAGSPVQQMLPTAYVANGGTIDPSHWHYYQTATGTLTGLGLNAGGSITLANSTAVQFGGAANQTNTYYGYYGAFTPTIAAQPTGRTIAITSDIELISLAAVFPVLPFPSLTVPTTNYTLDTLTDQGIVLEGDNLAWAELVALNSDLTGAGGPSNWVDGYFVVLDNQHLEYHPRPGQVAGTYNLLIFNPAVLTNTIQIDLVAPTAPKFYSEAAIGAFGTQHIYVHSGPVTGPAVSAIALSSSLLPTTFPGIATLGLGDNGNSILMFPGTWAHNATTGIARVDFGPIPPGFGLLHFQAVTLDLGNLVLPLPTTNVWSCLLP